jgi:hypothetical protein
MALTKPEDFPVLEQAVNKTYTLLREEMNLDVQLFLQTCIAASAIGIFEEAKGDKEYAKQILSRYIDSLSSIVNEALA